MSEFSGKTNDQLLDRLGQIEQELESTEPSSVATLALAREVTLIHIELARRTATGWRPL
jgi:hypothetical protein